MDKKMDKKEAGQRIAKLKKLINHHRHLYHVLDKTEISDAAFDTLKNELEELERKFPDLITLDSPTQRVGGEPLEKFKKVSHKTPVLSLNDAFGETEIKEWEERTRKLIPEQKSELNYFCELKLDGLAASLVYNKGVFVRGATRGDGKIGEDITQNLKTISSIPLRLRMSPKNEIEIRGEVVMLKKVFEELNKNLKKNNKPLLANTRNAAAGSMRQLDSKITASRKLDFYVYGLASDLGQKRHQDEHLLAKSLGFKTIENNKFCKNLQEVIDYHHFWVKNKEKLPFECDGIVVVVDNVKLQKKLGAVGKAPRWMIAYKFPPEEAATVIENVKIQVGRTGVLTPVAILKPVEIRGAVISRATLHNKDEISRLGLKIGDTVIVGRAGDVIPDVKKVLKELRAGKEKQIKMPVHCPVCGKRIEADKGGILLRCVNKKCLSRKRRALYYFTSRRAFNIEGLGPKIIDALLDQGLIQDAADLFELKGGDLIPLERFAEKSAENLIESISAAKKISLARFIVALGIAYVGEETAQALAQNFFTLKNLKKASLEDLESVNDIGPTVAESIYSWFREKHNKDFLERLLRRVTIEKHKSAKRKKFADKKFVLTGGLSSMEREQAKAKIREFGGQVSESISKETDYLIAGKDPGLKLQKARKLGVKILSETDLIDFLSE